jgi:hypothetical protein
VQTSTGGLQIESIKQPFFIEQSSFHLYFHVYNSTNKVVRLPQTTCHTHIYNSSGIHILEKTAAMDSNNEDYEIVIEQNISMTSGYYAYITFCNNTQESGYISDFFEITKQSIEETNIGGQALAAIILLPLIFGFLIVFAAFLLDPEEHPVLRIFMMLMALLTWFGSAWMAVQTIVRHYGFPDLQDSTTFFVWIIGIFLFIILSYFMIYIFHKTITKSAQNKEEMMLR